MRCSCLKKRLCCIHVFTYNSQVWQPCSQSVCRKVTELVVSGEQVAAG